MNRKQDISQESAVIRATTAFSGEGDVDGVIFEDIESNMSDNSHIFSGMIFPDTAVILMKGHIQWREFSMPQCLRTAFTKVDISDKEVMKYLVSS